MTASSEAALSRYGIVPMSKLHKNKVARHNVISRRRVPSGQSSLGTHTFSAETIGSLTELGSIFRRIHKRMIAEGYVISNGHISKKIEPPTENEQSGEN
jgi:hypothetical protein